MAKILIVDDASFMRMTIKDILNKNGYNDLCEACDGMQAVESYKSINPDLVLMDIAMPYIDGVEALKQIREINCNALVVMMSAMGQEAKVIEAIKVGAKDFIMKPFNPDRLLKTVSGIIG